MDGHGHTIYERGRTWTDKDMQVMDMDGHGHDGHGHGHDGHGHGRTWTWKIMSMQVTSKHTSDKVMPNVSFSSVARSSSGGGRANNAPVDNALGAGIGASIEAMLCLMLRMVENQNKIIEHICNGR